jgi:hypothetical protein
MNNKNEMSCCLRVKIIFTIIFFVMLTITLLIDNHRLNKVLEQPTETKITYTLQPMK